VKAYQGITTVCIFGVQGTMVIQRVRGSNEVKASARTRGKLKVRHNKDKNELVIYPQGYKFTLEVNMQSGGDATASGSVVGHAESHVRAQFLSSPATARQALTAAKEFLELGRQGLVFVQCPPGTHIILADCYGVRRRGLKRGWRSWRVVNRYEEFQA
jgi:hypothetical protein